MYQRRGTKTVRRLREARAQMQARRALRLAQEEAAQAPAVQVDLTRKFSIIDALMGMTEDDRGA